MSGNVLLQTSYFSHCIWASSLALTGCFFPRYYSIAAKATPDEKLKLAVQKLVDVDTIMNTMPNAIKKTCTMAM